MKRYVVSKFDENTFVIIDVKEKREICICGNYDEIFNAEDRAQRIALLLNENMNWQDK